MWGAGLKGCKSHQEKREVRVSLGSVPEEDYLGLQAGHLVSTHDHRILLA